MYYFNLYAKRAKEDGALYTEIKACTNTNPTGIDLDIDMYLRLNQRCMRTDVEMQQRDEENLMTDPPDRSSQNMVNILDAMIDLMRDDEQITSVAVYGYSSKTDTFESSEVLRCDGAKK